MHWKGFLWHGEEGPVNHLERVQGGQDNQEKLHEGIIIIETFSLSLHNDVTRPSPHR